MASSSTVPAPVNNISNTAPSPAAGPPHVVVEMQVCELQIKNLVDMQIKKGQPVDSDAQAKLVAQEALRQWKEAQSELQGKVERRTNQTDKIIYEIYQLVGLYSVFVGVVFTAAVQSETLKCQHIWSPVALCAVAWLIVILATRKRWRRYRALRATLKSEDASRATIFGQISKLKTFGYKGFIFGVHALEGSSGVKPKTPSNVICGVRASTSRVIPVVVTALTLILVGSFIHILCLKNIEKL